MVAPDEKAEDGDGQRGKSHKGIAEDALARETSYDIADDGKARQDHDIYGRMRIKPEHVLEKHRITAVIGIENADLEGALEADQQQGDGYHRGA